MSSLNLRDTVEPKSDQTNADDLLGMTKTITVTAVKRGDTAEQPVVINYEGDDGRPYKPCKSMRRVLIGAWGDDGNQWVGRSMTLFCDPDVTFGKDKVGGIRISHLSHIDKPLNLSLTVTRAKRKPYRVEPLVVQERAPYPDDLFAERLPAMREAIAAGKMTPEQVVTRAEQTGKLSDEQRAAIRKAGETNDESTTTDEDEGEVF